jgi:hypothetical protein
MADSVWLGVKKERGDLIAPLARATRTGLSVWFFWMNFQSNQSDKPERQHRPDEPDLVERAQSGSKTGHPRGKVEETTSPSA